MSKGGLFGSAVLVLGVICIAGIVHIASILAMPFLASKDAYARLAALAGPAQITLLPRAFPGKETLPFPDPAMARGLCLYDLSEGPLRIEANVAPEALMTLSFRGRSGRVFYSMTDRAAFRGKIEVLLVTAEQLAEIEAEDDEDEVPKELRLVAPTVQGFVFFTSLAERPSLYPEAEARIQAVLCTAEQQERK
jgi:uncharacterized membrane protein